MSRPRYDWWGYEAWKDVQGYNGRYQVSNYGRVKSFVKNSGGKLAITKNRLTGKLAVGDSATNFVCLESEENYGL